MNTRCLDGPAAAVALKLQRTPVFLRVVHDSQTWKWDALDQLDDMPKPSETIFVYRLDGDEVARGFACSRRQGGCRAFFWADYKLYGVQPPQDDLRRTEFWQQWTAQQHAPTSPTPNH